MRCVSVLCLLVAALAAAHAMDTDVEIQCNGSPNNHSVYTEPPELVKSVINGKLYMAGGDQVDPQIYLVHMWGDAYDMGYAYGQLLRNEIKALIQESLEWLQESSPRILPPEIQNFIEKEGVKAVLDLTWKFTEPFTPQYFYDEMKGIADGSGVDYKDIVRVNMIPELVQAACSMFGAWGEAIENTDGTLIQLRALDWNTDGPFQKYPTVAVYHPNSGAGANPGGHAFANVGWAGFIGSITGYSSQPMGICEKVWIHYNGTQNRHGYPWHFLLRDVLQFDQDIDQALQRIANAERTCSIFVGLGDGESNTFKAVEYSHDFVEFFNDKNYPEYPNHPRMNNLVYIDKHTQPSNGDPCFTQLLEYYYGDITAAVTMRNITAQFQTGDTHLAIYDYAANNIYVSNAGVYDPETKYAQPAYDRQFTLFDMTSIFAEVHP